MKTQTKSKAFSFEISLSVLNHLGRNLYRSFATVLGEAISNAWDADAKKVHIYIEDNKKNFLIKDNGLGMTASEFQNKFLKIGYSKRNISSTSPSGRPFIGRKGIGKLALLSCAKKITIISKKSGGKYVGGVIDNSGLDRAITQDLTPNEYLLGALNLKKFEKYTKSHSKGTIIYFENIQEGIKNSLGFLSKIIALYFRFSLLDPNFKVFLNDKQITYRCLDDLAAKTEFLWKINDLSDPYVNRLQKEKYLKESRQLKVKKGIKGFIASVETPRCLKIITTDKKVGVDLFVNGRLREKNILSHIPTTRIVESYLYGQIHFDGLDDSKDRFTSSREGVVADDPKHKQLLNALKDNVINRILEDWDAWRLKNKEDGDSENPRISRKERKAGELYNVISAEYTLPRGAKNKAEVAGWVDELGDDARYNFSSYADCFISENLIRKYIKKKKISLSPEAKEEIKRWRKAEKENKGKGNISIEIRKRDNKLSYLSMDGLANLVDKKDPNKEACLSRDAKEYKPIRDALSHTALLTGNAKQKLNTIYCNIEARIKEMLSAGK